MTESDAPTEFMWGAAMSLTQVEGAAPQSTWAAMEAAGRAPRSGEGNGFATNSHDDLALIAGLGLTHLRISLDWARLEPTAGRHDGEAVEHARHVLQEARDLAMNNWVCLHHISLPGWFADDEGGFVDSRSRKYFWARHVDWVAETFGDLVNGWIPVNEPVAEARRVAEAANAVTVEAQALEAVTLEALLLAQHDAWRLLRSGDQTVATSFDLGPIEAGLRTNDERERPAAADAAGLVDRTVWQTGLRMVADGLLSVPGRPEIVIEEAAGSFDLIGFTYHGASSVFSDFSRGPFPADVAPGPDGFAAWPEGLGLTIRRLADAIGRRPILVAGLALGLESRSEDDRQRVEYLDACHDQVQDAVAEGIDVRGLFFSSPIDCYEWDLGYRVRRGLIDRDRNPKPSAQLVTRFAGSAA